MDIQSLTSLLEQSQITTLLALLFLFNVSITAMEAILDGYSHSKRNWKDSLANVSIFALMQLLEKTLYGAVFFIALLPFYFWFSPFEIPMNVMTWLLALIVADFSYYWMHRIEHTFRLFWAHHSVHHSSQDYNLTIAMRICILESIVIWIFLVPMILIGFNPFQTIVAFILVVQYQTWIHTKHIGKLHWVEGVLNTPSAHRVHHGSNSKYIDKNFGSVLMIWDKLFGTYQKEQETVIYGLTENINTNNPIHINLHEYRKLWRDAVAQPSLWKKLTVFFGKLGP